MVQRAPLWGPRLHHSGSGDALQHGGRVFPAGRHAAANGSGFAQLGHQSHDGCGAVRALQQNERQKHCNGFCS